MFTPLSLWVGKPITTTSGGGDAQPGPNGLARWERPACSASLPTGALFRPGREHENMDNSPLIRPPSPVGSTVTCIHDSDDDTFDPASLDLHDDMGGGGCDQYPNMDDKSSIDGYSAPPPSSSLDGLETSRGLASTLPIPCPLQRSRELCSSFRHGGWHDRRQRTLRALTAASVSPHRLDRFARCGDTAWVLASTTEHGRYRLATNRCRDRFCTPCANEHRAIVCRNLRESLKDRTLRLMTLTLKSREEPLADQLSRLYASWGRLRGILRRCSGLLGGVAFVELTLNSQTRLWHPHLHVIFEGQWIDKAFVRQNWLAITGDSYIVDLRPIRDSNHAAGYVAKYASKALSANVVTDHERFTEAVVALQAHRLFATFGTFSGLHLSRHPESDVGWEPLRPLYLVIQDAIAGDATSRLILSQLSRSDADDPLTLLPPAPS